MKPFTNLFDGNSAFDCFYDESIIMKSKSGGYSQTIETCVFQDVESDTIAENLDTAMKSISILCRKSDWLKIQPLKRGDTIERPCIKKTYRIQDVLNDDFSGIVIKAREI